MSAQPQTQEIVANHNPLLDNKKVKFQFRKVIDKDTKEETKRHTVELNIPFLSVEGLVDVITKGGKELDMLLEAAGEVIIAQAREYLNSNEAATAENFPYEILQWDTISNLPESSRTSAISKETWEEFVEDYNAIMPELTGRNKESVELVSKVLAAKLNPVKYKKNVLEKIRGYLSIYINNTKNAEQFAVLVNFLDERAKTFLAADDSDLLDAI